MSPTTPGLAPAAASAAEQMQALRGQLEQRGDTLRGELRALEDERAAALARTQQDPVRDSGEQGEQQSHDAVRSAEQQRDAGELRDIAAALARMDEGGYGQCVDCGVQIPLQRLLVLPATSRCKDCQQRREKGEPPLRHGSEMP